MFKIEKDKSGERAEVIINGSVNIQNAAELKDSISGLYKEITALEIDHGNAESFDLSYLQLLLSLKRTMEADGKILSFKGLKNAAFISLLKNGGYRETGLSAELSKNNPEGKNNE